MDDFSHQRQAVVYALVEEFEAPQASEKVRSKPLGGGNEQLQLIHHLSKILSAPTGGGGKNCFYLLHFVVLGHLTQTVFSPFIRSANVDARICAVSSKGVNYFFLLCFPSFLPHPLLFFLFCCWFLQAPSSSQYRVVFTKACPYQKLDHDDKIKKRPSFSSNFWDSYNYRAITYAAMTSAEAGVEWHGADIRQ